MTQLLASCFLPKFAKHFPITHIHGFHFIVLRPKFKSESKWDSQNRCIAFNLFFLLFHLLSQHFSFYFATYMVTRRKLLSTLTTFKEKCYFSTSHILIGSFVHFPLIHNLSLSIPKMFLRNLSNKLVKVSQIKWVKMDTHFLLKQIEWNKFMWSHLATESHFCGMLDISGVPFWWYL